MSHRPIFLKDLSLTFPHKICFEGFNASIQHGDRIAIIGKNGSGKSSLLNVIRSEIALPTDAVIAFVPQIIEDYTDQSGGQRFNKALSKALSIHPNVLVLDEPTNHLDLSNRSSLLKMLAGYPGTLIVVSHDQELLNNYFNTLWHIDNGKITIFKGNYQDYFDALRMQRSYLEDQINSLKRSKDDVHQSLMREQTRAKKSKQKGKRSIAERKWPTIVSNAKATRAQETSGKKKQAILTTRTDLINQIGGLRLPEVLTPKFHIPNCESSSGNIVSISDGKVGYDSWLVENINIQLRNSERLAIVGNNGSGKSTIIKAIINDPAVKKEGTWHAPNRNLIGFLDQHYSNLVASQTAYETIKSTRMDWSQAEIRKHLNDFLFRKNEEVNNPVSKLSGGEKVRLSLAKIAALSPQLLILDEVTNNLDLETVEHVKQILSAYPGAMIVISHDTTFNRSITNVSLSLSI